MKRLVIPVAALAVASALATPVVAAPSNLCKLKVSAQLNPLDVSGTCKPSKTAHVGALTITGADWGTTDNYVGVQVYTGAPAARFEQQFGKQGKSVSLGSFAREKVGVSGVTLAAWVKGKGLLIVLNKQFNSENGGQPYAAPVLAFAKAVAKQL